MANPRAFRFAVQSFSASSGNEWRERARKVEDLGYSALHLADHILGPGEAIEAANHPVQELAAVPAMAVAAEATNQLKIGCRVFCIDYRPTAVLAKEAATLDLFSEGRLELGLGAGWIKNEYEAIGIDFDPPGTRISRLGEVVTAVKAFCGGEPMNFDGEHVRWSGFAGAPRSVQQPHPPIMIGGGSPRVLRLAGREANIVSLNFNNRSGMIGPDGVQSGTADGTAQKIGWVREGAGDRFAELELEIGAYFTTISDNAEPMVAGMAQAFGLTPDEMRTHPHALFGTPEAVCDELERRREKYGITYVTVTDAAFEDFAPVVAKLSGS